MVIHIEVLCVYILIGDVADYGLFENDLYNDSIYHLSISVKGE